MEILKINDYLSFIIEEKRRGDKITCLYDGVSIGYKNPCKHLRCNMKFIAEMTLAAEEMHRFERVFEPTENLN